jgi:RNA polymerase sigma-70 factor (ECF subfamily)
MTADVDMTLQELWEAGRASWPDLSVPIDRFGGYVRARLPDAAGSAAELARLNLPDLYLACACACALPGALEAFDRLLMARVPSFVRQVDGAPEFADEVCQLLRQKLFVSAGAGPKIAHYSGRGTLLSWLRVVSLRTALNLREARHPGRDEELSASALGAVDAADLDLEYLRQHYREDFETAVRTALEALPARLRRVLRMQVAGLSTGEIGTMLQVHQTTVVRWLGTARESVRERARQLLRERLGLTTGEFDSIGRLLLSRLDISIESCLRDSSIE